MSLFDTDAASSSDDAPVLGLPTPLHDADGVTLYEGDCLALMPFLRENVDGVFADLPYGTTRNGWDVPLDTKLLWSCYHRLAGERTPVVLFGSGLFTAEMILSNREEYAYTIVWDKDAVTGHLNAKKRPMLCHEDLAVFYGAQPHYDPQMVYTGRSSHSRGSNRERTINHWGDFENTPVVEQDGYQYPRSIVKFKRPKLPKGMGHPSQKPVALAEWLILTFTKPGDLVLDNVCGSGTTLVAARKHGRRAVGIELAPDRAQQCAERLASGSEEDRWW